MAGDFGPGETGKSGSGRRAGNGGGDEDLERRRRELEASLATRLPERPVGQDSKAEGAIGYGQAFKLSSEFIAGIAVGLGIGWLVDRLAGTSPWGLIVFLLLGFGAAILNVLRSAGLIAEFGRGGRRPQGPQK